MILDPIMFVLVIVLFYLVGFLMGARRARL